MIQTYSTISDESPAARCLALIERHAARFMMAGGGPLSVESGPRQHRELTDEKRAEIIACVQDGKRRHEVARICGVAPSTVTRVCIAAGFAAVQRGRIKGSKFAKDFGPSVVA